MLKIKVNISDVDYIGVSEKAVPIIIAALEKSSDAAVVKLLSKFKGVTGKALSVALKALPQGTKDSIAVGLLTNYSGKIIEKSNDLFSKKNISLRVKNVSVEKVNGIELSLEFSDIDYEGIISTAYPVIINRYGQSEKFRKLFDVLEKLDGNADKVILSAIGALSQAEKNELVCAIVSSYESEITSLLAKLSAENGIGISFDGIEVICENCENRNHLKN